MTAAATNVEDVAANFIEDEVGRHDWVRNWEAFKDKNDPVHRIEQWARGYAMRVDPNDVVSTIDQMAKIGGAWR